LNQFVVDNRWSMQILDPMNIGNAERAARAGVCALAVMAKAPKPGAVKTRLSPPLTSAQAAALNVCFLRDTTQNLAAVAENSGAAGLVSYTPVGEENLFAGLLPQSFALIAQRGDGFGERLLAAAEDILACGYSSVCLIDSDSPTVPAGAYAQAVDALSQAGDRIVLGPSADGGYYVIGMKRAHPAVFERINWSTATVAAETRERARMAGIEVVELPIWYDVDDAATLAILRSELLAGMAPGFAIEPGYAAGHTRRFLHDLDASFSPLPARTASGPAAAAVREEESQDSSQ
jgi:rSAM/selenodomain-associated transferase 1